MMTKVVIFHLQTFFQLYNIQSFLSPSQIFHSLSFFLFFKRVSIIHRMPPKLFLVMNVEIVNFMLVTSLNDAIFYL